MSRKSFAFNLLLVFVTLVAIAGAFTAFQRKRSSFERLDFQYHWQKGIIIVDAVDRDSGAERAGLKAGDQIWIVGGSPADDLDGLKRTLRRMGPVPLVVARGNEMITINYAAPPLKIDYPYLFLTFIGFLYLAIGLFTLFRGTRDESRLFYFVTLLAFIVYVYTPAGKTDLTLKSIWVVEEFARIFLPPLTLHFFLRFPRTLMPNRWTLPAIYTAPAALLLLDIVAFNVERLDQRRLFAFIDRWQMLDFAVYFTLAFIALTYTYRTSPAIGQKKQIKWIYLGMGVGFIPFLVLYLIPFILKGAGSTFTTMAILPLALIPLAFAVSILKYKLWDVEVVIKEVLAYTVMFIFGMIAFSTVNLLLSHLLEERLALERNFLAFASGLLIAGVLVPMKSRLESWFDQFVYRETYRHRKAMLDFAQELATFHDLHELIDLMRDRLSAALTLQKLNLYVREGNRYLVYQAEPDIPHAIRRDDFPDLPTDRPLILDVPRLPDRSESGMTLLRAGYRYLFPLRYRGELEGMLICGTRRADEALSRDDLQLIGSLTVPLSLAIENARLYGRLRRQIEEIRSLKEYNENIIESSSSAIVVVANDATILTANRAFWDLIGVEAGDERSLQELFPPFRVITRDAAATEHQFINQRREEKEVTVSSSPFNAPDAPVGATVLVIGDISERVRLERELQEKERLAALGLLAAGVAHEVNTPLTGISSYAQLLLKEIPPDDPKYALLKKMEMQSFRASHLVNNLLDFAANRHRTIERVDLPELVRNTISIHEDLFKAKQVNVEVVRMEDLAVKGNFYELQQVLTNLLLNARDAVAHEGNIWIGVHRDGCKAVLTVRDDGHGIASDIREKIFTPLVTTKRAQGGTGLGLAISDRIVRAVGGNIAVESCPGKGATFSVTLPLWQSTADELPTRNAEA